MSASSAHIASWSSFDQVSMPPTDGGNFLVMKRTRIRRLLQRLFEFRQQLEQIADQADVRDLEDRRFRILVDRDDGARVLDAGQVLRSEEHTSELQSQSNLVCRLLLEKKKKKKQTYNLNLTGHT